jgi:hypothetical protein
MEMPKIYSIDVTNRDAVQASRIIMAKLQKTMLNHYEILGRGADTCIPTGRVDHHRRVRRRRHIPG